MTLFNPGTSKTKQKVLFILNYTLIKMGVPLFNTHALAEIAPVL